MTTPTKFWPTPKPSTTPSKPLPKLKPGYVLSERGTPIKMEHNWHGGAYSKSEPAK